GPALELLAPQFCKHIHWHLSGFIQPQQGSTAPARRGWDSPRNGCSRLDGADCSKSGGAGGSVLLGHTGALNTHRDTSSSPFNLEGSTYVRNCRVCRAARG